MSEKSIKQNSQYAVPPSALRWCVDESTLGFRSTREVEAITNVIGQPIALEAMRFGVESAAPAQNVYVRGAAGTGRLTLVHSLLDELQPEFRRQLDRCYVHNFQRPDRPRLITLPAGMAPQLRRGMKELAGFVENRLDDALAGESLNNRREIIARRTQDQISSLMQPLETELEQKGLALVQFQSGPVNRTAIFPLIDGKPTPPEELAQLQQSGKITPDESKQFEQKLKEVSGKFNEVSRQANRLWQQGLARLAELNAGEARSVLNSFTSDLRQRLPQAEVAEFIDEVINDVVDNRLNGESRKSQPSPLSIYGVNVLRTHGPGSDPVITENAPSAANLLGTIEPEFLANGQTVSNHMGIRAGALVHADGGYLVLDAHDVLSEPGAWRVLMRALRTGSAEIVPAESPWPFGAQSLKPDPIEISVRVILIGSGGLYYQLDQVDQDFTNLFKVLADFDSEMERSETAVLQYAGVVARICQNEKLPHFSAGGVAALVEHGARIAARKGKVTARFGRIADIVREAAFLAGKPDVKEVSREHVEEAVRRTKYRASLPSVRFQERVKDRTLSIQTQGRVTGQINGLAVLNAGPLSYGFPARITATVGAGRAGVINVEGAASMSGSIHTKGFHILGGLLRHLLRTDHPLTFTASIAFEQSYGGIDGDSASGAEICCLLSALTDVPINQGLAMTGAIDQHGRLQAIGAVNEKIEGFFDVCKAMGLNGEQGVIIPSSNAGDLMLRRDVVAACEAGEFTVYAVQNIQLALEILTGIPAGEPDATGSWPEETLFGKALQQARTYWQKSNGNWTAQAVKEN